MRHLLLALLIALLPLRGWVGDAMATQMAAGQIQHSQSQEQGQHHGALAADHSGHEETAEAPQAPQAAEPDCAGHSSGESTHMADGHCESCAACQACNTVALSLMETSPNPVFKSTAQPRLAADSFASADAALRQKPPIS
ncbi:hypothetical protein SAMN05216350_101820 [Polaromonas sp. YR568]|uniref:hypothetical protein n=1 Tax=Polaromonas sp. YR568 TaxID=1855301 RepID=UPI0008EE7156|nr:hypothetical protein [Polaromonas sp. YR568]SFU41095.1 hypothetical protein SAMN05216350_101820 [Polaromonas sp. YR568]